jgi:hypothetical protein
MYGLKPVPFKEDARLQQFPRRQLANKNSIRGQKIVPRQLPQRAPAKIMENPVRHLAGKLVNRKKLQIDRTSAAVRMARVRHPVPDIRGDAQLLIQLTPQSLFRAFAVLDLPSGKLPFQTHRLIRPPLTNQYCLLPQDQCGHHQPNYLGVRS